ncbi:MAG TPA: sterol desaturase family protein [Polyangiaceae bacterium]|nr:sterol desaturase family protein [Polyangiaceae bacterium]
MKTEDLVGILILGTWLGMLVLESLFPARSYPRVRGWRWLGALGLVAFMAIGTVLPLLLPPVIFEHTLLSLGELPAVLGAPLGFAMVTLVGYLYHRACHRFDFMWRWFHQLHHSAPRLDIGGSMMFHPLEMAAYSLIQLVILVPVLGLSAQAAAFAGLIGAFYSLFQHLNVRTPRWLGYVIQRPESHGLHHEQGVHAFNYGDLPLWDVLFGTFRNPQQFAGNVGFGDNQYTRVGSMLIGRDVSRGTGTQALQSATVSPRIAVNA